MPVATLMNPHPEADDAAFGGVALRAVLGENRLAVRGVALRRTGRLAGRGSVPRGTPSAIAAMTVATAAPRSANGLNCIGLLSGRCDGTPLDDSFTRRRELDLRAA